MDEYKSLVETLEIKADRACMKRIREAEKARRQGKGKSLQQIRKELKIDE